MSSLVDDQAGSERTYYMLPRHANAGHVAGSSMILIIVVNSALIGVLFAGLSASLGAAAGLALGLGTGAGLFHLVRSLAATRCG